ncbi:MAG TPA: AAA family ATPase [Candidatus Bathyarchaeia archaeon]|nr:AAA family ATPase [Candidatus Bathyarchaeia archaeon]
MKSLQLSKPHLLVVIGIPGAGKSAFATAFAKMFTAPLIDYAEVLQLAGDGSLAKTFIDYTTRQLLMTQQTIVIDGPGNKAKDRREFVNLALKHGYATVFVWVQTEQATAENRAVHSRTATMTLDQFDEGVLAFENPTKGEPVIVISGKHTYPSQARTVLKRLVAERPVATATQIKIDKAPPRTSSMRGRIIR